MTNKWYWDNAEQMIVSATDNSYLAIEDFIMFTNGVEREREQLRACNARLATLVTPKLASLLCDLAAGCDHSAWLAAERGRDMAARIREALEVNDES